MLHVTACNHDLSPRQLEFSLLTQKTLVILRVVIPHSSYSGNFNATIDTELAS